MTDADVKNVFDHYVAAVKASDADALLALYANDAQIFDMMEPFERHGWESGREMIEAWLGEPGTTQDCAIEDLDLTENGDLAVARAAVRYGVTMADGRHHTMWNRATWALRRIDGAWKIIHEHTSVPLANEDMQPMFEGREA